MRLVDPGWSNGRYSRAISPARLSRSHGGGSGANYLCKSDICDLPVYHRQGFSGGFVEWDIYFLAGAHHTKTRKELELLGAGGGGASRFDFSTGPTSCPP